jgi:cell division protein ZapD
MPTARILYEYPFNEGIRTMLRLEHLFERLGRLMVREDSLDHHFALVTIFEVMDVASRADLKSDLLKELERHKAQLQSYRGHPGISEAALDEVIGRIDHAFQGLIEVQGKAGQALTTHEWLMSVRSRIGIPAGTCEFDLPGYYAWQQHPAARRQADLERWAACLGLLRDSGVTQRMHASAGQFQQRLPEGKGYHLLRLHMNADSELVPEISGHRLLVSVRMLRADNEGRLRPTTEDTDFEMTLCT